jgi:hypothetical protein
MTISAKAETRESDLLERALELYRDLSLALRGQIIALREGAGGSGDPKERDALVRAHHAALQRVLDIEAGLGKRTQAGGGAELDLDAARAEIRARLAQWLAGR